MGPRTRSSPGMSGLALTGANGLNHHPWLQHPTLRHRVSTPIKQTAGLFATRGRPPLPSYGFTTHALNTVSFYAASLHALELYSLRCQDDGFHSFWLLGHGHDIPSGLHRL